MKTKLKMFVFLTVLGISSSMLFLYIDWEFYGECLEEGLFPSFSDGERCSRLFENQIPQVFGVTEELIYGNTTFEMLPSVLIPGKPTTFEIKFQYISTPSALDNLVPVFEINPASASSNVQIDVQPIGVQQGQIVRIPVTITVDPSIEHEKIFLSVYFTAEHFSSRSDAIYKSGWNDSLVLSIGPRDDIGILVDYEIIEWDDFEYEFEGDAAIFKNNLAGLGILEAGTEYYVIQKTDFKTENFGNKDTRVNATIGYAIQPGDQMLHPPMHENATDAEHEAFNLQMVKFNREFSQQSTIGNSYDFVVDVENPFYVKFPLVLEESGQYTRQFYKNTHIFEGPSSSGMGGLVVVDRFSKAVDENGECKNKEFRRIIKHDYSTIVCVNPSSVSELQDRGWALK